MERVRVQQEPFDQGALLNEFVAAHGAGAVVSFTGIVRDVAAGLSVMEIEHYPGMTERAIGTIVDEAQRRWNLTGAAVIHRHGRLGPADVIMMVLVSSPHRAEAFAAAEFLMDYLKSRAPFWKKEITGDGAQWVEARDADEDALRRW